MILQCSHFETIDPLTKNPINQPCIIYLHCHSGSRLESLQYLEILISNGFSLFCFDFSGSGLSQGEYVTLGLNEVEDVGCVVQYLVNNKKIEEIGIWGRSMGGVTALMYSAKNIRQIKAIVVDSAFSSLEKLAKEIGSKKTNLPGFLISGVLKILNLTLYQKAGLFFSDIDTAKFAKKGEIPGFFALSKKDELVNPEHMLLNYQNYKSKDKTLYYLEGSHNSKREDKFKEEVLKFLKSKVFNKNDIIFTEENFYSEKKRSMLNLRSITYENINQNIYPPARRNSFYKEKVNYLYEKTNIVKNKENNVLDLKSRKKFTK